MPKTPELPDMPYFSIDDGFFQNGGVAAPGGVGLPPLHPRGSNVGAVGTPSRETVEITDEELAAQLQKKTSMPTMANPKAFRNWDVKYGTYDLGIAEQREELEKIETKTLRQTAMLIREEWNTTPTGATIVSIKWLEKQESANKKRSWEEKEWEEWKKEEEDASVV